ncbi:MAG TPA: PKD domain-containing protein [Solirubrobacteraceae bacterium]|nr:PKD domain-containing protein [Solirubrobacteraceae bacterium]
MTRTPSPRRLAGAAAALALAMLPAASADARLGDPDPAFGGGDGLVELAVPQSGLNAAAILADGRIVVAGHGDGAPPESQAEFLVARLGADGQPDPSFGGGDGIAQWPGVEDADLYDLAVEPGGGLLVAGAASGGSVITDPNPYLARLDASGAFSDISPSPLPTGIFQMSLKAVAPLPDGRIAVAGWGWPSSTAGQPRQLVVGLLSDAGVPDATFSGDGWDVRSLGGETQAFEVVVDSAGRLVVSGFGTSALAGTQLAAVLRYELGGSLDESFSTDGQLLISYPAEFAGASRFHGVVQRGDELLAAGFLAGGDQGVLQRITAEGTLTAGFGTTDAPNGAAIWPGSGEAVVLTSRGGAVVAGRSEGDALQTAWLTESGTPDPAAGGIRTHGVGLFVGASPLGAALGPGDGLVVAGSTATGRGVVARFLPNAAPAAALSAPAEVLAGAPAELTAAGSTDPEGETLRYAFDLDGDGAFEFDGGENPLALRSFAIPGTYTVGVRASDPRGGTATAQRQIAVTAGPAVPQPVLGEQGVARPVRGIVRYRLPGRKRFRRMVELTAIPNGTEIDARKGRVLLTVLHDASGALDGARFYAGRFRFRQGKAAVPVTTLKLTDGTLSKCRKGKGGGAKAGASGAGVLAVAARIPRSSGSRRLWGNGRGKFRTRGRYGAATVRGTKWLTDDRCDGTLVRVKRGVVDVRDLQRPQRKVTRLEAGEERFVEKRGT